MANYKVTVGEKRYSLTVPEDVEDVDGYIGGFVESMSSEDPYEDTTEDTPVDEFRIDESDRNYEEGILSGIKNTYLDTKEGVSEWWDEGLTSSGLKGAGETTSSIVGYGAQAGLDTADFLKERLTDSAYKGKDTGVEITDEDWSLEKAYSPENVKALNEDLADYEDPKRRRWIQLRIQDAIERDFGFDDGQTSVDTVLDAEGFSETAVEAAKFAAEHGIASFPHLVGLMVAPGSYLASRSTEHAYEIAKNKGHKKPTADDTAQGIVVASLVQGLDKFGLAAMTKASPNITSTGKALMDYTKRVAAETSTEAVQEPLEYAGQRVGTNVDVDPIEAAKSSLGGVMGAVGPAGVFSAVGTAGARAETVKKQTLEKAHEILAENNKALEAEEALLKTATTQDANIESERTYGVLSEEGRLGDEMDVAGDLVGAAREMEEDTFAKDVGVRTKAQELIDKEFPEGDPSKVTLGDVDKQMEADWKEQHELDKATRKAREAVDKAAKAEEKLQATERNKQDAVLAKESDKATKEARQAVDEAVKTEQDIAKTKQTEEDAFEKDTIEGVRKELDDIVKKQTPAETKEAKQAWDAKTQEEAETMARDKQDKIEAKESNKATAEAKKAVDEAVKEEKVAAEAEIKAEKKRAALEIKEEKAEIASIRAQVDEEVGQQRPKETTEAKKAWKQKSAAPENLQDTTQDTTDALEFTPDMDVTYTRNELRKFAKDLGVSISGTKADTTARIKKKLAENKAKKAAEKAAKETEKANPNKEAVEFIQKARQQYSLNDFSRNDLRDFAKDLGLGTSGNKDVLIERINEAVPMVGDEKADVLLTNSRVKRDDVRLSPPPEKTETMEEEEQKAWGTRKTPKKAETMEEEIVERNDETNEGRRLQLQAIADEIFGKDNAPQVLMDEGWNTNALYGFKEAKESFADMKSGLEQHLEASRKGKVVNKAETMEERDQEALDRMLTGTPEDTQEDREYKAFKDKERQISSHYTLLAGYLERNTKAAVNSATNLQAFNAELADHLQSIIDEVEEYKDGLPDKFLTEDVTYTLDANQHIIDTAKETVKKLKGDSPARESRIDFQARGRTGREGMTPKGVRQVLDDAFGKGSFPDVQIVNNPDVGWAGQYNPRTDEIFLNSANLEAETVQRVLEHEYVHYLIRNSAGFRAAMRSLVIRSKNEADTIVAKAREVAERRVPKDAKGREKTVNEETLAYMVQYYRGDSLVSKLIRGIRALYRKKFKLELSEDEAVALVRRIVKTKATPKTRIGQGKVDYSNMSSNLEADEFGFTGATDEQVDTLNSTIDAAEDPKAVRAMVTDKRTVYMAALDTITELGETMVKPLALWTMPNRLLIGGIDRMLYGDKAAQEKNTLAAAQKLLDESLSSANEQIDAANHGVLTDLINIQRLKPAQYKRLANMMVQATFSNRDATNTSEFRTIDPDVQAMYIKVRDFYKKLAYDKVDALEAYIDTIEIDTARKRDMQDVVDNLKKNLDKQRVYFPFSRFGSWKVTGLDPNNKQYTTHHDTKAEAARHLKKMEAQGYTLGLSEVVDHESAGKEAMSPEAFEMATKLVDGMKGHDAAQEAIWQAFLHYSPHVATYKKQAKRRNIAGMSLDITRSLNQAINRDIRTNERLKVQPKVSAIHAAVFKNYERKEGDKGNLSKAIKEFKKREMFSDQRASWSKNLTKFNFIYYIGLNVASATINTSQLAMFGIPISGSKHGHLKAARAVQKEFLKAGRHIFKFGAMGNLGYTGVKADALKRLREMGAIDATQAHMYAGLNEGDSSDYSPRSDAVMKSFAYAFHRTELLNRVSLSMASFEMEYAKNGGDFEGATQYAYDVTFEAMHDYSETGKSRAQRSDAGNVLLALKTYPINVLGWTYKNAAHALKFHNATEEETKIARSKLAGMAFITTMIGGARSLPLSDTLMYILGQIFGDEDEIPMEVIPNGLKSLFGEDMADIILKGPLGKVTGVDIHSKVSMGLDMLARVQGGDNADAMKDALIEGALGPVLNMGWKQMAGIEAMWEGRYSDGFTMMLGTAAKNAMIAEEALREGVMKTGRGTKVADASFKRVIMKATGFSPAEFAEYYENTSIEYQQKRNVEADKEKLMDSLERAIAKGRGRYTAIRAIRKYNRTTKGSKISMSNVNKRIDEWEEMYKNRRY